MSDRELVERIQNGDSDAFRELYDAHARLVYRYIMARVSNQEDAEDLTAETFVRAWRSLPTFQWRGTPISAWLLRIAHNLIVDKYKRKSRLLDWLPWSGSDTEPKFTQIEHRDEIFKAFESLSYQEQTVLYLHYFEDYTLGEVAESIGKTPNAVRVSKFRALQRLKEVMQNARP